jgi:hypothetical protein
MMDINDSINQLVSTLSKQILDQVKGQIESDLARAINDRMDQIDIGTKVSNIISAKVNESINKYTPNTDVIDQRLTEASDAIIANVLKLAQNQINFPNNSIPLSSINFANSKVSGDNIEGGIIKRFGSTGIDDQATDCRVTILDGHTVFENTLLAQGLTVKGITTLEGDVIIRGEIPVDSPVFVNLVKHSQEAVKNSLDTTLFNSYSDLIFDKIKQEGLDLTRISLNGATVIDGKSIGNNITESNLQKVGELRELQVSGETLLSESLYTSKKRVGVNTIEPAHALSVWDEEIEIGVGKQQKDTGVFGTPRDQRLVLSSNKKDNITLNTDGSTTVKELRLGSMSFTSSDSAPSYSAPKGTVVFNNNPSLGGPLGWVSLGDARWANFGIID